MASYSQFGQDQFVVHLTNGQRNGFFVEAGAGDGIWISNTLLLERMYDWTGILIEPTQAFRHLKRNRARCFCDNSCLAAEEKPVTLVEIYDRGQSGLSPLANNNRLLSRVTDNVSQVELASMNSYWGIAKTKYITHAVPLVAVLKKYQAPRQIDYLSLDVEGYEWEIMRSFPFDEYSFRCLGIERPTRELHALLTNKGYRPIAKLGEDLFYVFQRDTLSYR
jgi:hypothetical protein